MPVWTLHPIFAAAVFHKLPDGKFAKRVENRAFTASTVGLGSVVLIRASKPKAVKGEHQGSLAALQQVWPDAKGEDNPHGAFLGFVRVSNIVEGATSQDPQAIAHLAVYDLDSQNKFANSVTCHDGQIGAVPIWSHRDYKDGDLLDRLQNEWRVVRERVGLHPHTRTPAPAPAPLHPHPHTRTRTRARA